MFKHQHPYAPFIQHDTQKLIVGTLPPPRFSTGELLEKDVNFCYGSYYNSLWLYIDVIHRLKLRYDNSQEAIDQRKQFLVDHKIGVCDIVESCKREKMDASDLGMQQVKLRNLLAYLKQYPSINTILFTGGNSKNGPEYFFRKHIKEHNIKLKLVSSGIPRIHQFNLFCYSDPENLGEESKNVVQNVIRTIKTVSLTSASGSANRAIGSIPLYKQLKTKNHKFNTFDFRVMQYREFF
ncbi:uracil-DNA glycosylase family protein [Aestuariivivens sp. NBU2969]|uniref:uracil-DNA glycosylase family protein n=1 Tax=Aestuariivivens sp. NBU2969 TaxID=2873267 RepID=UPI001CBB49E3|nr:uracil-DNA glycosylase family protein [Aestuariivivens sp. NBU2969]